jgi:hypothetical protein
MTTIDELGISKEIGKRILDLKIRAEKKQDHFDSFDVDYHEVQELVPFNIYHLIYPYDDPTQK